MATSDMERQFASLNTALQDQFEQLEIAKQELAEKEAALEREKEQMMKVKVEDDDVIQLNVGGEIIATTRSTLCQIEGSLLACMFSGRWEERLCKDKQGNYFLDFDPVCFKPILSYLRAKRIETPEQKATKPPLPKNEEKDFWSLVAYLGLQDELRPSAPSQDPNSMINNRFFPMQCIVI
jgi:hypothetical protein